MKTFPFCSIIVLNYQGEELIESCLNALRGLNYPHNRYEIIVVDNHSKDKSTEILTRMKAEGKEIKLIFLDKNFGFSKGNNVGIKQAKGEFVALINNDCIVNRDWLREAVKTALKDKKIFAVTSKILLYPKYINVKFQVNQALSPVYAWLTKSKLYNK